jgi:hypothetical protein
VESILGAPGTVREQTQGLEDLGRRDVEHELEPTDLRREDEGDPAVARLLVGRSASTTAAGSAPSPMTGRPTARSRRT